MKQNLKSLSAEIHDILLNHDNQNSGIVEIAKFIDENFNRKNKLKTKIVLTEGSQKHKILSYMVKNPDEWVYAKTFQNKNFFGKTPFVGYETGPRLSEINSFGYFDEIQEKGSWQKKGKKKFRIKECFLNKIQIALNTNTSLPRLK